MQPWPGLAFYMDTNADCDIGSHNLTASQHQLPLSPADVAYYTHLMVHKITKPGQPSYLERTSRWEMKEGESWGDGKPKLIILIMSLLSWHWAYYPDNELVTLILSLLSWHWTRMPWQSHLWKDTTGLVGPLSPSPVLQMFVWVGNILIPCVRSSLSIIL